MAVAGLTLLGALLNTTGLAISLGQAADTEREMRVTVTPEMLARYGPAERYYRESYHHLPFEDTSAISKMRYRRLGGQDRQDGQHKGE